jgi:hypothetical protein
MRFLSLWRVLAILAVVVPSVACTVAPTLRPSTAIAPTARPTRAAPLAPDPPESTAQALPAIVVAQTDDLAAGLPYRCSSRPFEIGVLYGPPGEFERYFPSPSTTGFHEVGTLLDVDKWWLTYSHPSEAWLVGETSRAYASVKMELREGRTWIPTSYGRCNIQYAEVGIDGTGWWINREDWPAATDRELTIRGRDACPGSLAARLRDPIVRYGADAILIVLLADKPAPESECGFGQVASLRVMLDEPVGLRGLFDGGVWPARDAHKRTDRLILSGG